MPSRNAPPVHSKRIDRSAPSEGNAYFPEDLDTLLDVKRFLDQYREDAALIGPDGEKVSLPIEVYQVLVQVIEVMRQNQAILVAPKGLLLTTQEAAEFLGVSRPTLVKLLEDGAIPFEKPNRHRRVPLADLLDYQEQRRVARRETLNRLTEQAGELGLNDGTDEDYAKALKKARKRHSKPKP